MGLLGILVGLGGYVTPHVRNVEEIIPDYDELAAEIPRPE
jgi:hypothetical protein